MAFVFNLRGIRTSSNTRQNKRGKIIGRIIGSLAAISIVLYLRDLFPALGSEYLPEQQGEQEARFFVAAALEAPGAYLIGSWVSRLIARIVLPRHNVQVNHDKPGMPLEQVDDSHLTAGNNEEHQNIPPDILNGPVGETLSEKLVLQISHSMKEKKTPELVQILTVYDTDEWSPEAFEAIRRILRNRNNS